MTNPRIELPRVRRTPHGKHLYRATLKGYATYGWGNTPDEARTKLAAMIAISGEKRAVAKYAR